MPFYDINRAFTSNATPGTESTHLYSKTVGNQETESLMGVFAAGRFTTAGGAVVNIKDNTGTTASGGTSQTPVPKNRRSAPAAQTTWFNDGAAITIGTTLITRMSVGFANTGGMGGWVPLVPGGAFQAMPNATNPVDFEFTSNCAVASVTGNITCEFMEGTS